MSQRIVFLTGCSRGIGLGILKAAILDPGTFVHGYARNAPDIQSAQFKFHAVDLSLQSSLADFTFPDAGTAKQVVLINNAATLGKVAHVGNLNAEEIDSGVRLNLTAPMVLSNAFISSFRKLNANRLIINISTGAATNPYDGWSLYCSTKSGSDMLARVIDKELKTDHTDSSYPFMVRSVAPGVVETAMQKSIRSSTAADFSNLKKFQDLKANGQLSDADAVGKMYMQIVDDLFRDPSCWPELIFRIPPLPA